MFLRLTTCSTPHTAARNSDDDDCNRKHNNRENGVDPTLHIVLVFTRIIAHFPYFVKHVAQMPALNPIRICRNSQISVGFIVLIAYQQNLREWNDWRWSRWSGRSSKFFRFHS